jgi:NRAMP (natural resistance-associated macrophage protein)-like metal ion transporter
MGSIQPNSKKSMAYWANPLSRLWKALGPGLTTGAADDDPSGIATYSQAGAQFGFALTWTMLLALPFMAAVQIISARIGWETRRGLAQSISQRLPRSALLFIVGLLVVANTINIAADLAAMGEGLRLVLGGPALLYAVAFGLLCLTTEVFVPYHRYAGYLKYLTLVLLVYVATAFSVHVPWGEVLISTLVPTVSMNRDLLLTVVAVFGTTISPLPLFLASLPGGRGVGAQPPPSFGGLAGGQPFPRDFYRHLGWDGRLECRGLLHHRDHRRHTQRSWGHQHSNRLASS